MENRPNFLIVGAPKCGTTTLYFWLLAHPHVFVPSLKEPHFFTLADGPLPSGPGDLNPTKINKWETYLRLFAPVRGETAIGEASTTYLQAPQASENIVRYLGTEVKLIVTLRNPVDRAYSAYLHKVRNGYETLSFEEALEAGPERVRSGWHPVWDFRGFGFYSEHIQRLRATFGETNVRIYLLDDIARYPEETLRDILGFLGVRIDVPVPNGRRNPGGLPRFPNLHRWLATPPRAVSRPARVFLPPAMRSRIAEAVGAANLRRAPAMRPETREGLVTHYEQEIRDLERVIGRDLSSWMRPTVHSAVT